MGMFSFLTGKKDGKDAATPATSRARSPARTRQVPPALRRRRLRPCRRHRRSPPTSRAARWDTGDDSPFSAPAAWNTGRAQRAAAEAGGRGPQIGPLDPAATAEFQQPIIDVIKTVYDPEIPVDIYELGLIYEIIVDATSAR